jgi:hypothetical protein
MNEKSVCRYICTALLIGLPFAGHAQSSDGESVCEDKGTNGMVSALLCPEGLDHEALAAAGRGICEKRIDCGAWIWTDPKDIPSELPDSHDALGREAVQSALGIWLQGREQLIVLKDPKK